LKKDIALSDTKLKSLEKDKSAIVVLLSDLEKNISKKNAEVKHLSGSTCPYCNQHYEQAQEKLEKAKLDLIEYDKEVVALGVSLGGKYIELEAEQKIKDILVGKLAEKDGDYQALLEAKKYIPSIDKLTLIKKELPIAISKYEELSIAVNPHHDALEELENYEEIKIDTKELDDLKDELEHNKFLLKLLTDKNSFIRKKIISKNISKLNQRLGHYLDKFGLPHAVTFTSDMYCEITEYDRTLDYGNLSGGEQKRINLALAFAFGDVGADLSQKINIMFTDEIDGGAICQNGMENIINVLKDKAKEDDIGLWIISHRAEMQNRFPKEMTIVKQHGFASIQ
jgi:DNA repair exonuclease SbcCD ATPase subunit